jgi:hypothetical protein
MNNFEQFKSNVEEIKNSIFGEIDSLIEKMEQSGDVEKFYEKGVRSAASRLRKELQNVRKAIHMPTFRTQMTRIKDAAKNLRDSMTQS